MIQGKSRCNLSHYTAGAISFHNKLFKSPIEKKNFQKMFTQLKEDTLTFGVVCARILHTNFMSLI